MAKFKKKPIVVEAVQWFPNIEFGEWKRGRYVNHRIGVDKQKVQYLVCECVLKTDAGLMTIVPGDWIITGIKGERYTCKPDIFEKTYEPV